MTITLTQAKPTPLGRILLLGKILFPTPARRAAQDKYTYRVESAEDWRRSVLSNARYKRANAIREAHEEYHKARTAALMEFDTEAYAALIDRDQVSITD